MQNLKLLSVWIPVFKNPHSQTFRTFQSSSAVLCAFKHRHRSITPVLSSASCDKMFCVICVNCRHLLSKTYVRSSPTHTHPKTTHSPLQTEMRSAPCSVTAVFFYFGMVCDILSLRYHEHIEMIQIKFLRITSSFDFFYFLSPLFFVQTHLVTKETHR